jgi:DNA-directed RNA polymerase subunit RPC12/RpoP
MFIEACFPGALTGETEVTCPHCNALLTVPVNDPLGEESYRCCKCGGSLLVNWGDESVTAL